MKPIRLTLVLAAAGALACFGPAAHAQKGEMIVNVAPVSTSALSAEQAAERYRQGALFEHRKDLRSAFVAYTEAGEAGHGLAQKRLGDFYSSGNAAVERDYETALKWYEKARAQGIEIPKPITYPAEQVQTIRLK